ncbi:MAG: anti-sigma factor, partial [Cupriavidus sp.]
MTIDETLLMAYVDGELPPAQRAEVEALVARDPDAAALVAALEASKLDYAGAFAAQPLPPVPESLVRSVDALIASHRAGTMPGAGAG